MKENLLALGMALLSVAGYSQNKTQDLENIMDSFESIKSVQDGYSKLCEYSSEVPQEKVKEACLMSAYEHALEYLGNDDNIRQAVYELDSLVQTHKISPQYINDLLSQNTLETAKSKYMVAKLKLENSSVENNKSLIENYDILKAEYDAINEIQTGAERVQKLYPSFNKERISKYLRGAFYMKDVFENWELYKSNDEAKKIFEFLKWDIQSYPYKAEKYVDNLFDRELPKKLAREFYDGSKKLVDSISDDEYDKIDEYNANLLRPNYLLIKLEKKPVEQQQQIDIVTSKTKQKTTSTAVRPIKKINNRPIKRPVVRKTYIRR